MAAQASTNGNGDHQSTEFELRRAALVGEIGDVRDDLPVSEEHTDPRFRVLKAS